MLGETCVLEPRIPSQESRVPAIPNVEVLSCVHNPLTQDDEIRSGNTHGEGRVLGRNH